MNPMLVVAAIQGVTKIVEALTPVAQQVIANRGEGADQIKAALSDLQSKSDLLHAENQQALRGG